MRDLAGDVVVGIEPCVSIGDEIELDYVQEPISENAGQIFDNEIGAVWAQSLVIQTQLHFPSSSCFSNPTALKHTNANVHNQNR